MATTIAAIDMVSKALEQKIGAIKANSKEEQDKNINELCLSFATLEDSLRRENPFLFPLILRGQGEIGSQAKEIASIICEYNSRLSKGNTNLHRVYSGTGIYNVIGKVVHFAPKIVDFDIKPHVLMTPYSDDEQEKSATRRLEEFVLWCMMSLPRGQVRVNIINLQWTDKANILTQNLPDNLCRVCLEQEEVYKLMDEMSTRIKDFLRTGRISLNQFDVELIILLDYPKGYETITDSMKNIIERGGQAGIHFIVLSDLRNSNAILKEGERKPYDILEQKERWFYEISQSNTIPSSKREHDIAFSIPFLLGAGIEVIQKAFFDYIKGVPVQTKANEGQQTESKKELSEARTIGDLSVTVGKKEDGVPIDFMLDTVGHVHAFVLGQSGSGKSVFLHSVLIELIKKYRPSDLCLYLLDFKLGGVEFNRYRDIKHVKALLVDNSDIQITLEILRDLSSQMRERGKMLREAGVSNIQEYNQKYPNLHLPQILFVADECHELFNMQGRGSRMVKQEIQSIITKIAKEGRSQGVHLLLATQTLAGAEISDEILNNITDHYLLKCSIADSEKMVRDSSRITANQQVGQVFYHHTESQYQFLSTYMPKEQLDKTIQDVVSKTLDLSSNGQFYFSGAQIFNMDASVIESVSSKQGNNPVAILGRGISLNQEPLEIALKRDFSENLLLFGIDEDHQVTRTTIAALLSLIISYKQKGIDAQIKVIDCGNDDDADYLNILDNLEDKGLCQVIARRERALELRKLAESIANENAIPTILVVIGQERFRELKLNLEIKDTVVEEIQSAESSDVWDLKDPNEGLLALENTKFAASDIGKKIDVSNYEKAMRYILENGPEQGVHTVLQIDKPSKLLFQDSFGSRFVFSMFKHFVMLRSEQNTVMKLGLSDDIHLEELSSDQERLRAYYYSEEDDSYQLFSPYMLPTENELNNILKQL